MFIVTSRHNSLKQSRFVYNVCDGKYIVTGGNIKTC